MGFAIPFSGWILFFEIVTIIAYIIDVVMICRMYLNLKKRLENFKNLNNGSDINALGEIEFSKH
jgi:hypothetical protein